MSGKPFDDNAKKRLSRHIIGGDKQEYAEKTGVKCKDCGGPMVNGVCADCEGKK